MTRLARRPRSPLTTVMLCVVLALLAASCAAGGSMTVTTTASARGGVAGPAADGAADAGSAAVTASAADVRAFEATPAFLAYAAGEVAAVDSMRFEVFQDMSGSSMMSFGSRETPLMTGEISGARSQVRMDLGGVFASTPFALPGGAGDLSMHMITDGSTIYLHAPMFASIAQLDPTIAEMPGMGWITTVAEGWGSIDAGSFAGSDVFGQLGMGSTADSLQFLAMLESVGDVLDGGRSEVRGVPTNVVYANVELRNLIDTVDTPMPIPGLDDVDAPISIEVHIDDENRVRRMAFQMDLASMVPADQSAGMDLVMWQQVDFFDFDTTIEIVPPLGAVDITSELALLGGLGGFGG